MPLAKRSATSWISTLDSKAFAAIYYDGRTSERWPVEIALDDTHVQVTGNGILRREPYRDVKIEPQVGRLRGQIRFADGAMCEIEDGKALMQAIPKQHQTPALSLIHRLENKLRYITLTLALAIIIIWGLIEFGVPYAARSIAYHIPLNMEQSMGEQVLNGMDKVFLEPSELPPARIAQLQATFGEFIRHNGGNYHYRILFRKSDKIGANAFALPSGIIVFTDDMVKLAKDDRELLAVLAHEMGHVEERHTLRHVLQDSLAVIVLVMITGDIHSASSLVATIPTLLVQAKFSRQFEDQADAYAAQALQKQDLSPRWLGTILSRLEKEHDNKDALPNFLSSHPSTPERLRHLRALKFRSD